MWLKYLHGKRFYLEEAGDGGDAGGGAGDAGGDAGAGDAGATGGEGASGDAGGQGADAPQPDWPTDWRQKLAGEDEKLNNIATRYQSPNDVFKALVAAQQRIRSGELKPALPENATEEQLKAWREESGIPASPEDYAVEGIDDDDKEAYADLFKTAHESNMGNEHVQAIVAWDKAREAAEIEARQKLDHEESERAADDLRAEWGADYQRNRNLLAGLLSQIPESVRDDFAGARLPDGTAIFNHPDMLRALTSLAMEANPVGAVVPNASGDPGQTIDDEIGKIEKLMREDRKAYNQDEKLQSRYRDLLGLREKYKKTG